MSDETTALVARIRELADGEDPADVEALVGRIENLHPAKRILLALRGHRIGRDERVVALLDAIDSVAACTFASWALEDVLLDLDEWSAFQAESFGLDRDLFHSDPLGLAQFHDRLECLLRDRRIWRCGWDPAAHVALVYLEAGTFVVRMDPSTQRWQGAPASLHDILRLAQLARVPVAAAVRPLCPQAGCELGAGLGDLARVHQDLAFVEQRFGQSLVLGVRWRCHRGECERCAQQGGEEQGEDAHGVSPQVRSSMAGLPVVAGEVG